MNTSILGVLLIISLGTIGYFIYKELNAKECGECGKCEECKKRHKIIFEITVPKNNNKSTAESNITFSLNDDTYKYTFDPIPQEESAVYEFIVDEIPEIINIQVVDTASKIKTTVDGIDVTDTGFLHDIKKNKWTFVEIDSEHNITKYLETTDGSSNKARQENVTIGNYAWASSNLIYKLFPKKKIQ